MALVRWVSVCASALLWSGFAFQCLAAAPEARAHRSAPPRGQLGKPFHDQGVDSSRARLRQPVNVAYSQPERVPPGNELAVRDQREAEELNLQGLIEAVQARNPSVQAMAAAWRAAAQRYPQVVSLNDPMFGFMVGPASWGSNDVDDGYMVEARQQIPWHGKREARGRAAQSEARAASLDVVDTRLRIRETTQLAFYDYYLARRELELNRQNVQAVRQFRQSARTRYEANQVTQQDYLQAEVELADTERRQIELERMNRVAIARINTLLRVAPDAPLPPPPNSLPAPIGLPPAELLQQSAVQQRPDLAAVAARIRAEQAALTLACREYYPDVEVVARYDAFWQPPEDDLRPQVGMNMNVPLYKRRRGAAVREAAARVAQRRAEFQQRVTDINFDVQVAYEQMVESVRTLQLYERRLLPATQQNAQSARVNYDVGKSTFLELIQAQRQLIGVRERQQEAITEYHRRRAALERVIAGPVPEVVEEVPLK